MWSPLRGKEGSVQKAISDIKGLQKCWVHKTLNLPFGSLHSQDGNGFIYKSVVCAGPGEACTGLGSPSGSGIGPQPCSAGGGTGRILPPGPGLATQLKPIPRAPLLPSVPSSWTNSSASGACNQLVTRRKGWERNTKGNSWASRIGRDLLRAMWLTATQHLHLCVSKLCQKHP